jgi:prevent-host-death family protein
VEHTVTATELSRCLSDILNRVYYRNERFVVERNGEPVAVLAPPGPVRRVMLHDALRALGELEFPGDGFADDLEAARTSQGTAGFPEWPS